MDRPGQKVPVSDCPELGGSTAADETDAGGGTAVDETGAGGRPADTGIPGPAGGTPVHAPTGGGTAELGEVAAGTAHCWGTHYWRIAVGAHCTAGIPAAVGARCTAGIQFADCSQEGIHSLAGEEDALGIAAHLAYLALGTVVEHLAGFLGACRTGPDRARVRRSFHTTLAWEPSPLWQRPQRLLMR